jgi:O-antigen ligase
VALAYLVFVPVTVVAWVGTDTIVSRFTQTDWTEFNGRYGAWSDAWNIASRFPLAGTGLNTYGTATLFYQQHDVEHHYVEAHNDYLQLVAEGGVLVAIPAAAALVAFMFAVRQRFVAETSVMAYWLRVGAVTGLVAIGLQETVEFSLQMPGNAALFATLCAIALHRSPSRAKS